MLRNWRRPLYSSEESGGVDSALGGTEQNAQQQYVTVEQYNELSDNVAGLMQNVGSLTDGITALISAQSNQTQQPQQQTTDQEPEFESDVERMLYSEVQQLKQAAADRERQIEEMRTEQNKMGKDYYSGMVMNEMRGAIRSHPEIVNDENAEYFIGLAVSRHIESIKSSGKSVSMDDVRVFTNDAAQRYKNGRMAPAPKQSGLPPSGGNVFNAPQKVQPKNFREADSMFEKDLNGFLNYHRQQGGA